MTLQVRIENLHSDALDARRVRIRVQYLTDGEWKYPNELAVPPNSMLLRARELRDGLYVHSGCRYIVDEITT